MLLAIDVRNTHTVVGLIAGSGDHAKVEQHWRIRTEPEVTAESEATPEPADTAVIVPPLVESDTDSGTGQPHVDAHA